MCLLRPALVAQFWWWFLRVCVTTVGQRLPDRLRVLGWAPAHGPAGLRLRLRLRPPGMVAQVLSVQATTVGRRPSDRPCNASLLAPCIIAAAPGRDGLALAPAPPRRPPSHPRQAINQVPLPPLSPPYRNYHLNGLVRVHGVITRRTAVFPQLRIVKFDCTKCGYLLGPFTQVRPPVHLLCLCCFMQPWRGPVSRHAHRQGASLSTQRRCVARASIHARLPRLRSCCPPCNPCPHRTATRR